MGRTDTTIFEPPFPPALRTSAYPSSPLPGTPLSLPPSPLPLPAAPIPPLLVLVQHLRRGPQRPAASRPLQRVQVQVAALREQCDVGVCGVMRGLGMS